MKSFYISKKFNMKKISLFILVVFFLLSCQKDCLSYEIKKDHPRLVSAELLLVEQKGINQLKKEAQYYLNADEQEMIIKNKERTYIRLYSYLYFIDKDEKYFKKARKLVNSLMNAPATEDDQQIRTRLQAYAYYYDLCFDKLSNLEKEEIKKQIIWHINWLDQRNDLRNENFGGGHQHYAQISALIGALAIYYDDPEIQEIAGYLQKNLSQGFQSFFRYLAEEDGGFHMWWEYSRYYIFGELEFNEIWKAATREDLFKNNSWLDKVSDFFVYGLRDDFTYWGTGDNHSRYPTWMENGIFQKIAAQYNNLYAQYMFEKLENDRKGWPEIDELFFKLLWEKKNIPSKSIKELPKVKEFKRIGTYIFREGWKKNNVSALFKNTPIYFFNHSHRDANSFEIWYKNDLAIDSGYYGRYGSDHWWNYYIRTIAHNTVLINDPSEKFLPRGVLLSNDGGQKFITEPHNQPYNVEDLKSEVFNVGSNEFIDKEDYSLVIGDATKAYSAKKCELFKRYFLWLKKVDNWEHPIIVVFDKVISTKPEFEKTWLLHSNNKPKVENNLVTIINGDGKLWNYVIEPQDYKIDLVGGKGHEFEVNGVNFVPDTTKIKDVEKWAGAWRVEIKQKKLAKESIFLNVLVPTEKNKKKQPNVKRINNGVRVENWEITFKDNDLQFEQVTNKNE